MNRWTLEMARNAMREITPIAKRNGYLVAMYGSVPDKGEGNDLDLLLVPWRPDPLPPESLVREIARAMYGTILPQAQHESVYWPGMAYGVQTGSALMLDLYFRESVPRDPHTELLRSHPYAKDYDGILSHSQSSPSRA